MLNGKGQQWWMTNDYEEKRRKAMLDRTKFSDAELERLDITEDHGGGRTDPDTYIIKQFPFPIDKVKEKVDIREVDKRVGGGSDL